jgi:arginase
MGPSAIRIAGIDEGVREPRPRVRGPRERPGPRARSRDPANPKARFLDEIAECCRALRARSRGSSRTARSRSVVGGDHSIACGTVAAISSFLPPRKQKIGLIWFDAHGDFNTPETSESGNIHGMPLACCVGRGVPELVRLGDRVPMVDVEKAVLVGVRTIDARRRRRSATRAPRLHAARHRHARHPQGDEMAIEIAVERARRAST